MKLGKLLRFEVFGDFRRPVKQVFVVGFRPYGTYLVIAKAFCLRVSEKRHALDHEGRVEM